MTTEKMRAEIFAEFDGQFGKGYKDPLNPSVQENVRDAHRGFLVITLSSLSSRLIEKLEGERVKKHDNVIPDPTTEEAERFSDYEWCGIDINAYEEKMYNLALTRAVEIIKEQIKGEK